LYQVKVADVAGKAAANNTVSARINDAWRTVFLLLPFVLRGHTAAAQGGNSRTSRAAAASAPVGCDSDDKE
jgi:hypothetical protein